MEKWNEKCRFFNEKYACETLASENYLSCKECKFSSEYSHKILIIKLGALGDVLRTTPILEAIKEKYPDSIIYWMVEDSYGEGLNLLKNNPYIDKVLVYNMENVLRIQQEKFDILFSLETDTPGTLLANIVQADEKYGYYFNNGASSCYNREAEEYLETAFLTHVKLKNRKTYQELIFNSCNLPYKKQEIIFELSEEDKKFAEEFKKSNNLSAKDKILGINFGSGKRWPSKSWSNEKLVELIILLKDKYKIILLGGVEETERLKEIETMLKSKKISIIINNPKNTLCQFASIINLCDAIITTDSMALHLASSLKKNIVALFFSTPDWEIESYGRMKKLSSPLFKQHFFSNLKSEELSNSISAREVIEKL
ncbi:glycosyltransferase family 9 protein [Candidatus Pacearchaeota archaeon]|nr:glycosyltransferase family 9 protein [Candidatus Pacearchaeota archaeon]